MSVRPLGHLVVHAHGDLPKRVDKCPMRGCQVDENGMTSCSHMACPVCGVGPPVVIRPDFVFYCDVCAARWKPKVSA